MSLARFTSSDSRFAGRTGGIFAPDSPEISRRVVLKASALFAAMATGVFFDRGLRQPEASAQSDAVVSSFDWVEADQVSADEIGSGVALEAYAPFPFSSVGASWPAEIGDWPVVLVEVSSNGVDFSQIFSIGASGESGLLDSGERIFSPLVCATRGIAIRYRTIDDQGNPAAVPGLTFTFIDSSAGPTAADFPVSISAKAAYDVSSPPALISRSEWGADESLRFEEDGEWWVKEYQLVEHAIIHHSETPNSQDPLEAIRSIYYYHAVTRGWHDIGYNYLVDKLGNIYEGRSGGRNVVGGHAYEYAHGSSGICFIGEFFDDEVTEEALAAMVAILAWTCRDLDPRGFADFHSETRVPTICAHRDVNLSTCPGDRAYAELPVLRDLVAQTLANFPEGPAADLVVGDQARMVVSTTARDDAGFGAPATLQLPEFTVGVIIAGPVMVDGLAWYLISTDFGRGWVEYSALFRDPPIGGTSGLFGIEDVVELKESANLRRVPGVMSDVVQNASQGTVGLVVAGPEDADGYRWYRIMTSERFAWVASTYLTWSDQPAPDRPIPTTDLSVGETVAVHDGPLQVHRTPGLGDDVIGFLETGAVGTLTNGPEVADEQLWFEVRTSLVTGWVSATYLERSDAAAPTTFAPGDAVYVSDGPVNLREEADEDAPVIAQLQAGDHGTILDGPVTWNGYSWYEIETAQGTGWVVGSYFSRQ
ncbi:MAG: SH3 domain-containing protein [Thermomicrobiales bacterium]